MAEQEHSEITAQNIHVPGYTQDTDPGAVGAGKQWVDTTDDLYLLKVRNSTNTGWETVGDDTAIGPVLGQAVARLVTTISYNYTPKLANYDDVRYDPQSTITTGASTWKWTAPYDCLIHCVATISFTGTQYILTSWRINGAHIKWSFSPPSKYPPSSGSSTFVYPMNENDYLQIWMRGYDNLTRNTDNQSMSFNIGWIGT